MKADLILTNGNIWTVDKNQPRAEALAISGNKIIFVGSSSEVRKWSGEKTRMIDIRGHLVLPGFNDCHTHFINAALRFASNLDLYGVTDIREIQLRLKRFSEEHPDHDWLHGMRWFPTRINHGIWPSRADLDAVESKRPVAIFDIDGHSCWTNTAAIERMGYNASTPNPEGGEILRETDGFPSGIFFEVAQEAFGRFPVVSVEQFPNVLQEDIARWNGLGITSVSNNGIAPEYLDAIEMMDRQNILNLRISEWPMILEGLDKAAALRERFANSEKFRVHTVKIYMDGVSSNYSAWMLDSYADKPGETGYPVIDLETLEPLIVEADRMGFQVATHAVGTRAVRTMLDMYEKAAQVNGKRDARHRVEHVENSHPDDRKRFAELGVISSMTPVHCTADLEGYYISRLGDNGHLGFAWKSFLDNGVHLSFGTDWPAVDLKEPSPLKQIFGAVTRCTPQNFGKLNWHRDQCISVEDAIRSYTLEGAYAEKMEHAKGSLTAGKLADVIVLSENILETPPETLLDTRVLMTIFDGRIVHDLEAF